MLRLIHVVLLALVPPFIFAGDDSEEQGKKAAEMPAEEQNNEVPGFDHEILFVAATKSQAIQETAFDISSGVMIRQPPLVPGRAADGLQSSSSGDRPPLATSEAPDIATEA